MSGKDTEVLRGVGRKFNSEKKKRFQYALIGGCWYGAARHRHLKVEHIWHGFGRHIRLPCASPELLVAKKGTLALTDQVLMLWADFRRCRSDLDITHDLVIVCLYVSHGILSLFFPYSCIPNTLKQRMEEIHKLAQNKLLI